MSRNATIVGAEATLSNWDGHFVVEDSASVLCCTPFLQRDSLTTGTYNGYASTEKVRKWSHNDVDANSDEGESISSTDTPKYGQRSPGFSSPNRSTISGTGVGGINRIASARLRSLSRQTTLGSSILGDSMAEIIVRMPLI